MHLYIQLGSVYYAYRTAGNIGEEQSLANWRMCFKPSKIKTIKLGVTVLNTWMQD